MNTFNLTKTICQCFIILLIMTSAVSAAPPPHEPDDTFLVSEDVNVITGLYIRTYSLHHDGIVDYKTARQIIISEYNEHWNSVVETKENPLFYWHDPDHDGTFGMWVDRGGEGCFCDMVPYKATYEENP